MATDIRVNISAVDRTAAGIASARARLGALGTDAAALASRFSAVGTVIAGAFGAAGLGALVKGAVDALDAFNDLRDATGSSVEKLSALEAVALRTGGNFDDVAQSLVKFNQALTSAKAGSDAERVFNALGLSVRELRQLDPADALRQTAQALQQFANDGEKARATQLLFGKSLREVAPFLNDLAEAQDLAATATGEQAAEAEKLNKSLAQLSANATLAARALATALVPSLNDLFAAFNGPGGIAGAINRSALRGQLEGVMADMQRMQPALKAAQAELAKPFEGGFVESLRKGAAQKTVDDFAKVEAAARRLREELFATNNAGGGRGFVNPAGIEPRSLSLPDKSDKPGKAAAETISQFDRYIERLRDASLATMNLSAEEQARVDIALGKLGKLTDAQREQAIGAAQMLDQMRNKREDFIGPEIDADELMRRARQMAEIAALAERSTEAQFERLAALRESLRSALAGDDINEQTFVRAMRVIEEEAERLGGAMEQLAETSSEFSLQAARNIQSALGDTLLATLSGRFSDIGRIWRSTLQRMVAEAAAAKINEALFGDFFKDGKLGGLLGDAAKWLGANFGGARASGGPVRAGSTYLVGERGPELVTMGAAGYVTPNAALGGVSMPLTVHIDSRSDQAQVAQLVGAAVAEGQRRLLMQLKAAGRL